MNWVSLILTSVWIILGGAVVSLVLVVIWIITKYKFPVRIYIPIADGGAQPIDKKARILKDKDGVEWYKLQGKGFGKVTKPPADVIMVDNKGRLCAEGKLMSDGNIEWLKPEFSQTHYKQPLDTADRQILASEFAKANMRKKKSWWAEHGASTVALGAIVFLILGVLIFGGEFANKVMAPAERLGQSIEQSTANLKEMQIIVAGIQEDVQYIKTKNAATSAIPYAGAVD